VRSRRIEVVGSSFWWSGGRCGGGGRGCGGRWGSEEVVVRPLAGFVSSLERQWLCWRLGWNFSWGFRVLTSELSRLVIHLILNSESRIC
jgi:hypothetical protein